jgi:hypothetical protein
VLELTTMMVPAIPKAFSTDVQRRVELSSTVKLEHWNVFRSLPTTIDGLASEPNPRPLMVMGVAPGTWEQLPVFG